MPLITDRRLYLNADKTQVVEEDDPRATHLLAARGDEVSADDAQRYALDLGDKPAEPTLLERERAGLEVARNQPGRAEEARFRMQRVAELEAEEAAKKARANPPATKQVNAPPATKAGA